MDENTPPASETAEVASPPSAELLKGVRRIAVIVIIVSVSLAALVGIITVLTGDFGDTQAKILGTTSLVAGLSITALCHLAIVGRQIRFAGYAGLLASVVAFGAGVFLIWSDWNERWDFQEGVVKTFILAGILAVFLAQANLLLLLTSRRRKTIRISLGVTVVAIAMVYVLLGLLILTDGQISLGWEEQYARGLAIVAIFDALGTVVLPVLAVFIRESGEGRVKVTLTLASGPAALLAEKMAASGQNAGDVVSDLLEQATPLPKESDKSPY
jgi:hypothetical protein